MRVVWLPELTQNLLNVVVRNIHRTFYREGLPATLEKRPIVAEHDLVCAWRAYTALQRRAGSARSVIDTDRPSELAVALQALSPGDYARRVSLLGGLRLLHRGRSIRDGRDFYPEQLRAWFAPDCQALHVPSPATPSH